MLHAPVQASGRGRKVSGLRKAAGRLGRVAAFLALAFAVGYTYSDARIKDFSERSLSMSAPAGQRVHLVLQDGTEVWLNGGSSIQYPVAFAAAERRVHIVGEAMFDVARNDEQVFIVETKGGTVEVCGTKFDVEADSAGTCFTTALLRGSVRVSPAGSDDAPLTLHAGESAHLVEGRLVKGSIDRRDDYLWTDGIIALNSNEPEHIMAKIARAYNVEVRIDKDLDLQIQYQGKIRIEEGLEHALKIVLQDTGCKYALDRDNKVVTISRS